jgi:DNA processing protein
MKQKNDLKYLIALSHFPKFGPARLKKIKNHFQTWENAFLSSAGELTKAGIEEKVSSEFSAAKGNINPDEIMEKMEKENIMAATLSDEIYPPLLKEIYNPPQLIYYKGELSKDNEFNLAVVGSRKFTSYGQMAVEKIVGELANSNLTIVSGLALGIDSLAHDAALKANGRTIAVLGSGLDQQNIYPFSNRYLSDKIIASGGALISEFSPGTPPLKHNFPQRNRLISGISLGVLVIEAGEKSGALITANFALEQNREVFAVPGNIYSPVSAGTNNLIKKGARVVINAADILETFDLAQIFSVMENKKALPETEEEKLILKHLNREPLHINDIVRAANLDTSVINSTLTIMEMKGMVKNLGNMQYIANF